MSQCPHPHDLQSFIDGEIDADAAARIERHLRHCDACSERVDAYERVRAALLGSRRASPPEGLLRRVLAATHRAGPVRRLTCREARVMASAYIDEELTATDRETLEAHLFACDECFMQYSQMRQGAAVMRATPPAMASESLKRRILAAVAEESADPIPVLRPARRSVAPWQRMLGPSLAAAAVALFAFSVFQLTGSVGRQPASSPQLRAEAPATAPATITQPATSHASAEPATAEAPQTQAPVSEREPARLATLPGASQPHVRAAAPTLPEAPVRAARAGADRAATHAPQSRPVAPAARATTPDEVIAAVMREGSGRGAEIEPTPTTPTAGSRLTATTRSQATSRPGATAGRSRTPVPAPAPVVASARPGTGPYVPPTGAAGPPLTRPEPRRPMVASASSGFEETSEDDLEPTEWVAKRPESTTPLLSRKDDNDRRLAELTTAMARRTEAEEHRGLADEPWPN